MPWPLATIIIIIIHPSSHGSAINTFFLLPFPNLLAAVDMVCFTDPLVQTVCQLYNRISCLDDLRPSENVDALFTQLVAACIPPHPIDVSKLCSAVQEIRHHLIQLCGRAESLLETHYSAGVLAPLPAPLENLRLFPYYDNYLKLSAVEFNLLRRHSSPPRRLAFVGSGPLPLTSIVLARDHLRSTEFHNFDVDAAANADAARLVAADPDLSGRMKFFTEDIVDVPAAVLREYDVVFLAALVGLDVEEKMNVIDHLARNMAPGAILMLRSAHGARAFLYPVVEPRHLQGFQVLSVYHPTDEVVNSVVVARRCQKPAHVANGAAMICCSKCAGIESFGCSLGLVGELAVDEKNLY
ncbi:nicotianamine synthase [Genlisea aurea]|uniref:Nicotianamine synthase n=1 Tax=Genlisea aurea TaxID=192259 RepID=S8EA74_9LAMI|nr:nicotianamine synthase [Genlisea aurea]